jgi:hypothetical protein
LTPKPARKFSQQGSSEHSCHSSRNVCLEFTKQVHQGGPSSLLPNLSCQQRFEVSKVFRHLNPLFSKKLKQRTNAFLPAGNSSLRTTPASSKQTPTCHSLSVKLTVCNPEFSLASVRLLFIDFPFCCYSSSRSITNSLYLCTLSFIDKGVERKVTLENASVQDVKNALENLAKSN